MQLWKGIRPQTIVAFLIGVFIATAGTATAAKVITGRDIKNGSISEKDLSVALRQKLSVQVIEGPKGEAGSAGAAGATGAMGPVGAAGVAGAKGDAGAAGADGAGGASGADGADGASGADGAKGEPGAPGNDGTNGADGAQGIQGIQGIQGPKGDKGDPGAQGPAGPAAVIVRWLDVTVAPGTDETVTAPCESGEVAVGGTGFITGADATTFITRSVPAATGGALGPGLDVTAFGTPTAWRVNGHNGDLIADRNLVAEVLCAPGA